MAGRLILGIANPSLDDNGLVDSGATLTFYQNGLTTPQAVYTDSTLTVALANPLSCDASGRFPQIWAPDDALYSVKWTLTGVSPITYDNIAPAANTGSGLEISDAFYSTLALADAAAAAAGAILVIGKNWTLPANTTLTCKAIRNGGGKITLGNYNLVGTHTGIFSAPCQFFVITGTGRLTGTWSVSDMLAEWFGASPASTAAANATAINAALDSGRNVLLCEAGVYQFSTTIRFVADAQWLIGQGMGHVNVPTAGTTLKYTGSSTGAAINFYSGTEVREACGLRQLNVDANSLATDGVRGYDDAYTGVGVGAWWNQLDHVLIRNATVGLYLGNGTAPNFANDYMFESIIVMSCATGVKGNCGPVNFRGGCIFYNCSTTGLNALASSVWDIGDTKFSHNGVDITLGNQAQVVGDEGWYEESTSGTFVAATAGHLRLLNGHFHTNYATQLGNAGGSAGSFILSGVVAGSSASTLINGTNRAGAAQIFDFSGLYNCSTDDAAGVKACWPGEKRSIGGGFITGNLQSGDDLGSSAFLIGAFGNYIGRKNADGSLQIFGAQGDINVINQTVGVKLTSGANAWSAISDIRQKVIKGAISGASKKLRTLQTVFGYLKADKRKKRRLFLIAQEVQKVFPSAISVDKEGVLWFSPTEIIPAIVAAHNEQAAQIDELRAELKALKRAVSRKI